MAFFSEVKAKLGLDISPFERGLKQAQNSAGGLAKGLGKQFASTEKIAGALAAAVGLNMQGIANSIARFFTGFSEEVEAALENMVVKTGEAAAKQEAALRAAEQRREKLQADIARKQEERRVAALTKEQRVAELAAEQGKLMTEAFALEKAGAASGTKYLEIKNKLLDVENEILAIEGEQNKEREAAAQKAAKERQDAAEWLDDVLEKTEKELLDAEEKRLDKLKDQREELEKQGDAVRKTLADYAAGQRKALLPTSGEVKSGARNIGSGARRQLGELERTEAKARRLSDAEQRKMEEFQGARSEGDKRRFQEEGRALRTAKEAELGRAEKLKGGLEGRVSDIDTNKKSYEELTKIQQGIKDLNTKLEQKTV